MSALSTHAPWAADLPPIMTSVQTTAHDLRRPTRLLVQVRSARLLVGNLPQTRSTDRSISRDGSGVHDLARAHQRRTLQVDASRRHRGPGGSDL